MRAPPAPLQGGQFGLGHAAFDSRRGPVRIEPKYNGYRCLLTREGPVSRAGKRLPMAQPFWEELAPQLPEGSDWWDCELLGTREHTQDLALVVFDVAVSGSLESRLDRLGQLPPAPISPSVPWGVYRAPGILGAAEAWETCRANGMEGIVVKRLGSEYPTGITLDWIKFRYAFPGNNHRP